MKCSRWKLEPLQQDNLKKNELIWFVLKNVARLAIFVDFCICYWIIFCPRIYEKFVNWDVNKVKKQNDSQLSAEQKTVKTEKSGRVETKEK